MSLCSIWWPFSAFWFLAWGHFGSAWGHSTTILGWLSPLYRFPPQRQTKALAWTLHWSLQTALYNLLLHLLNSTEKRKCQISGLIDHPIERGRKHNCSYQFGPNWYLHFLSRLIQSLGNMSGKEKRNLGGSFTLNKFYWFFGTNLHKTCTPHHAIYHGDTLQPNQASLFHWEYMTATKVQCSNFISDFIN